MGYIDLHTHSTKSDGTLSPTELILQAKEIGVEAIALTDHDTIAGYDEALKAGKEADITVISGVEISTSYMEKEIHIVGLFVNCKDVEFKKKLQKLELERDNRNKFMVEMLNKNGIDIMYEEVIEKYKDVVFTRAHMANELLLRGYVKSKSEAFKRYLGDYASCYVKKELLNADETINMIKAAGGVAVLAHPFRYRLSADTINSLVKEFKNAGLAGIEVYYPTHTKSERKFARELADKYNLLHSGGSDFHGKNKPDIQLGIGRGNLDIPYELWEQLEAESDGSWREMTK